MALFPKKSRAVISFLTHIQRLAEPGVVPQKSLRVGLESNNWVSAALTVSYGGVLRVQDARFLQRPDAGVDQLQACCQLLLDVLLAVYMHTGHRKLERIKKCKYKRTTLSLNDYFQISFLFSSYITESPASPTHSSCVESDVPVCSIYQGDLLT